MDWIQVWTILGTQLAFFSIMLTLLLFFRQESRADTRMMIAIVDGIQKEIKDFHERLCKIEEKKSNER